jgi:HEAT repeat protein
MVSLLHDNFCWMQAADVLQALPGESGATALRSELPALSPAVQASIINIIGIRRNPRNIKLLAKYAAGKQPLIAYAATAALGSIGSTAAAEVLISLKPDQELGSTLCDAKLQAAERLSSQNRILSEKLYRLVWDDAGSTDWQKAAALKGLAAVGAQDALQLITQALTGSNRWLMHGAADALRSLPEPALTDLLNIGNIPDSAYPALLTAWGQRGVHTAEPKMVEALKYRDPAIQLAGINALKATGSATAVNPLLAYIAEGGQFRNEAKSVLTQMQGEDVAAILVRSALGDNIRLAALATEVLGARRDTGYLGVMLDVLRKGDPKAGKRALAVLRNSGDAEQLSALRDILLKAPARAKPGIAKCITAICRRAQDRNKCLAAVLDRKPDFDPASRRAMVAALSAAGGETALKFVLRKRDEATVRALIKWPDSGAVAPLIEIMESDSSPKMKTIAAAGGVQYARRVLSVSEQKQLLPHLLPGLDAKTRAEVVKYIDELSAHE